MRARARSWVAAGSRRALGRPRRRDTSPAAPSWTNARYRRRTWRSPIWSSPAARRRVSRRSAIRVRTCGRSSSFMLNVRGPAIPALCRKSGHLYFGGTGHLHFGPTAFAPNRDVRGCVDQGSTEDAEDDAAARTPFLARSVTFGLARRAASRSCCCAAIQFALCAYRRGSDSQVTSTLAPNEGYALDLRSRHRSAEESTPRRWVTADE